MKRKFSCRRRPCPAWARRRAPRASAGRSSSRRAASPRRARSPPGSTSGSSTLSRVEGRRAGRAEVGVEVEGRRELLQLVEAHRVVAVLRVAHARRGRGRRSRARSRAASPSAASLAAASGVSPSERQHARDVLEVLLALLLRLRVVLQVVVAVGQADAALAEARDRLLRVVQVGRRAEAEERREGPSASCSPRSWNSSLFDARPRRSARAHGAIGFAPSASIAASSMHDA